MVEVKTDEVDNANQRDEDDDPESEDVHPTIADFIGFSEKEDELVDHFRQGVILFFSAAGHAAICDLVEGVGLLGLLFIAVVALERRFDLYLDGLAEVFTHAVYSSV